MTLESTISKAEALVAANDSIVFLSHSRAMTKPPKKILIKVMILTYCPDIKNHTDSFDSLNQLRVLTVILELLVLLNFETALWMVDFM